jgi:uncharacterized membrane protein YkgB
MAQPRSAISWAGAALGAALVIVSFLTFWLGFRPAWFAVTGLAWGVILCTISFAIGATQRRGGGSG